MGETSLGIEYADPSTRPCDLPDVIYRGFNAVAALVDGLEAQGAAIDDPVMLHVSWQPTPGQSTQTVKAGDPVRWNTVNVSKGGMFQPQVSDYELLWNQPGYLLWLASVQVVNPPSASPSWELSTSRDPSLSTGSVVPLMDFAYDAGVNVAPTTSDQWLSMCTVWRIARAFTAPPTSTFLKIDVLASAVTDIEIAQADLVVLKLGDL